MKKKKKKRKATLTHGDEYVRRTITRFVNFIAKQKRDGKSF